MKHRHVYFNVGHSAMAFYNQQAFSGFELKLHATYAYFICFDASNRQIESYVLPKVQGLYKMILGYLYTFITPLFLPAFWFFLRWINKSKPFQQTATSLQRIHHFLKINKLYWIIISFILNNTIYNCMHDDNYHQIPGNGKFRQKNFLSR